MINEVVNNGFQSKVATSGQVSGATQVAPLSPAPGLNESTPTPSKATAAKETTQFEQAVAKLSDHAQNFQRKLSFSVSAETGRTIIRVYDAATDELIRQIPAEDTIKLAENIDATVSSLFIKEQA